MLTSYFDTLLNCIYDYMRLAKCTSECIRETLSNIPLDVKKLPETAEIIRLYISFSSDTDLKYALLKAKTEDLIEIINSSFDSGMNMFCFGNAELLFIKNFCKSTSKLICSETHHPPLCFELGNACFQLSLAIDNCLDAQAALCRALTNLFLAAEKIVIPERELLCLGFPENSFDTALQMIDSDGSFRGPTPKQTVNERFSDLPKQASSGFLYTEKSYSFQANENDYVTENYYFSSNSTGYGKSAQSVHVRKHINVSHHHRLPSTPEMAGAQIRSDHAAKTKVPVTVKKKDISEIKYNIPKTDQVKFSAVAPAKFNPGDTLAVDIYMYTDEFRSVVDDAIKNIEGSSVEKTNGYADAERNSRVRVELSCKEFDFNENVLELKWIGKHLNFNFFVDIPKSFTEKKINFSAKVFVNSMLATRLCFTVNAEAPTVQQPSIVRNDIKSIFISYASPDRFTVLTYVRAYKSICPDLDIFFDIDNIRGGDYWEETLEKEVKSRDALYLFWSAHAKASEWVEKEWRCALDTHGLDAIVPVPLEYPEYCPPPKELSKKNFNDSKVFMQEALRETPAYKQPKLIITKSGSIKYMDSEELIIGTDTQNAHIVIDDNAFTGILSTIFRHENKYYIKRANAQAHIRINDTELAENELTPLENQTKINVEGEEMIFYTNTLPSNSTKTA